MISDYKILPFGESALLIQFEDLISEEIHKKVKNSCQIIKTLSKAGVVSVIPAYNSVTVLYNKVQIGFIELSALLEIELNRNQLYIEESKNVFEIPVCYDESLALDIKEVSILTNFSKEEIIQIHSSTEYLIYFYGFVPCFMYLGGLDPRLAVRRRKIPRVSIPKGSVALADQQTAIYPLETPGGWQIIGSTPIDFELFCENSLPEMGDYLSFKSIGLEEYSELKNTRFIPQKQCK